MRYNAQFSSLILQIINIVFYVLLFSKEFCKGAPINSAGKIVSYTILILPADLSIVQEYEKKVNIPAVLKSQYQHFPAQNHYL